VVLGLPLAGHGPTSTLVRSRVIAESNAVLGCGFVRAAHTDDAAGWLLVSERVLHLPDLVNPDQPPFWRFAGSENYV
jgi:hypothetical protein